MTERLVNLKVIGKSMVRGNMDCGSTESLASSFNLNLAWATTHQIVGTTSSRLTRKCDFEALCIADGFV